MAFDENEEEQSDPYPTISRGVDICESRVFRGGSY